MKPSRDHALKGNQHPDFQHQCWILTVFISDMHGTLLCLASATQQDIIQFWRSLFVASR